MTKLLFITPINVPFSYYTMSCTFIPSPELKTNMNVPFYITGVMIVRHVRYLIRQLVDGFNIFDVENISTKMLVFSGPGKNKKQKQRKKFSQ